MVMKFTKKFKKHKKTIDMIPNSDYIGVTINKPIGFCKDDVTTTSYFFALINSRCF